VRASLPLLVGALLLAGCGEADAPPLPVDCTSCHDPAALAADVSDLPPSEWARQAGRGAVRRSALLAGASTPFSVPWSRRGRHDDTDPTRCTGCHPASAQGIRHGLSVYGPGARQLAFEPGTDCAARCHTWLPVSGRAGGFSPAEGEPPEVEGSFRPADLLAAGDDGHSRIWREGYAGDWTARYVARLRPGCAGCHNVQRERHGTISECTDCHRLAGSGADLHWRHVDLITERRADLAPEHADASVCCVCHGFEETSEELRRGACYNCHLSGHRPLREDGQPHFWAQ